MNASFAALGWIAWQENGAIFAQQFDQLDAHNSPSVLSRTATSTTRSLTVKVGCARAPCTVTLTITSGRTKLAGGSVTLRTQARHRMKLKLTPAGRRLRRRHRGTIRAKITLSEKIHGRVLTTTRTLEIIPHR